MVKRFSETPGVVFGDVMLSEGGPRLGQPGAGGWPTVRYFNSSTGATGGAYLQKTDGKMCDELGDEFYMQTYIEETAGVQHETRAKPPKEMSSSKKGPAKGKAPSKDARRPPPGKGKGKGKFNMGPEARAKMREAMEKRNKHKEL